MIRLERSERGLERDGEGINGSAGYQLDFPTTRYGSGNQLV